MDQRLSLITLAVVDLDRARRFYEDGLGWTPLHALDEVAFYQLPGLAFGLFERKAMEEDTRRSIDGTFSGVTLAINERSRVAVDALMAQAQAAGGAILKPAHTASWGGYSGYFTDPDGHTWEVAHNPNSTINPDGSTTF